MARREMLFAAGLLVTAATTPLAPAAEAAEVVVPPQNVVCRNYQVPANVNIGAFVKKQITVGGTVLNLNVNQKVLVVEKNIAVRVCIATAGDVVIAKLDHNLNGDVQCPEGAVGVAVHPRMNLEVGRDGGAVLVDIKVAVTDKDQVLDIAFDEMKVVIEENKRLELPKMQVLDQDGADADVCVGPVADDGL